MWFVLSRRATVWILWYSDRKPEPVWGVRKSFPVMMMDLQLRLYLRGDMGVHRIQGGKSALCSCPGAGGVAVYSKELKEGQWREMNLELDSEKSRNRKRRGMTTQCLVGFVKDFDLSRRSHWKGGWAANHEYTPPPNSPPFWVTENVL